MRFGGFGTNSSISGLAKQRRRDAGSQKHLRPQYYVEPRLEQFYIQERALKHQLVYRAPYGCITSMHGIDDTSYALGKGNRANLSILLLDTRTASENCLNPARQHLINTRLAKSIPNWSSHIPRNKNKESLKFGTKKDRIL